MCGGNSERDARQTRTLSEQSGRRLPPRASSQGELMSISGGGWPAARKRIIAGVAAAVAAMAAAQALAHDKHGSRISQSGEQRNMRRVGHVDLQGRPSYQPN